MENNILNENGGIKKSELIKSALKDAPYLDRKDIIKALKTFISGLPKRETYLLLNSKDINYIMVFDIQPNTTAKEVAEYIYTYLTDSSFVAPKDQEDKKDYGLLDDIVYSNMEDIKDIDVESDTSIGLYIGEESVYFKLSAESWVVEKVEGDNK